MPKLSPAPPLLLLTERISDIPPHDGRRRSHVPGPQGPPPRQSASGPAHRWVLGAACLPRRHGVGLHCPLTPGGATQASTGRDPGVSARPRGAPAPATLRPVTPCEGGCSGHSGRQWQGTEEASGRGDRRSGLRGKGEPFREEIRSHLPPRKPHRDPFVPTAGSPPLSTSSWH